MSLDSHKSELGQPTWEIATLFPNQGDWSEHEYLHLNTSRLIEFIDGSLEVLPKPTELHQAIAFFLCLQLKHYSEPKSLGVAYMAPLRVRVREGNFREPDVLFMLAEHRARRTEKFWIGADLVMEVVSEDDPHRDLVTKREEYAKAGITEYWIVDPRDRTVTVLHLEASHIAYSELGRFSEGQMASSALLDGFHVDVREVFNRPEAI